MGMKVAFKSILTDRFHRYRVAAIVLAIPAVVRLVVDPIFGVMDSLGDTPTRVTYWIGLVLLAFCIAYDSWEVHKGKRKVERMISKKIEQTHLREQDH